MALWQYSDWVTLTDNSARLVRLRLHMQEVSERVIDTEQRGNKVSKASEVYMTSLQREEARLRCLTESGRSHATNYPKFERP